MLSVWFCFHFLVRKISQKLQIFILGDRLTSDDVAVDVYDSGDDTDVDVDVDVVHKVLLSPLCAPWSSRRTAAWNGAQALHRFKGVGLSVGTGTERERERKRKRERSLRCMCVWVSVCLDVSISIRVHVCVCVSLNIHCTRAMLVRGARELWEGRSHQTWSYRVGCFIDTKLSDLFQKWPIPNQSNRTSMTQP